MKREHLPPDPTPQSTANKLILVKGLIELALKDPKNKPFKEELATLQSFLEGKASINEAITATKKLATLQSASSRGGFVFLKSDTIQG